MHPTVALHARGGVELLATVLLVALAAVCARGPGSGPVRLLLAHAAAMLAAALLAHAAFGSSPLIVSSYALVLVSGSLLGAGLLLRRLMGLGLTETRAQRLLLLGFVLALVGSRMVDAAADPSSVRSASDLGARLVDRARGGLSVFGAIAVVAAYVPMALRGTSVPPAAALDACAAPLALVVSVGRLGCLLAGCCFGAVTDPGPLSWPAAVFAPESPAGAAHAKDPSAYLWATQPLEAVVDLAIAFAAELLYRRRSRLGLPDGAVFAAQVGVYGLLRASLETLRADSPRWVAGAFTVWQVLGVLAFVGTSAWGALALQRARAATR